MASNSIPTGYDALVSLAEDAADGAHQHGAVVELAQNTETKIRADLVALTGDAAATPPVPGAQGNYNAAPPPPASSARRRATRGHFTAKATDVLKSFLGRQWNSTWAEVGFHAGSLAIPDDPLWYAFGFDRPADGQQPGPVQHLVLTAGGPGIVLAHWDDARRAERYRVLKQVVGTDATPVVVTGALHENELTLQGLPSGHDVKISVAAVNAAGEGPATVSAPFRVV